MVQDLNGKLVLLTGAASGIGKETVLLLARERCNFVLADIDEMGLRAIEQEVKSLGCQVFTKVVDVTNMDEINALHVEVADRVGTIDILVNNAGIGYNGDLRHTSEADWKRLFAINFYSALYMINTFLPEMIKKGGGQIVNISTGQVFYPVPTWGAYAASKAALATYSECLAWELAPFKIRVTTVYPGLIRTPFYSDVHATRFGQRLVLWYINALGSKPQTMARKIVAGIKKRRRRVVQSALNWATYIGRRPAPLAFDLVGELFATALCDRDKECKPWT